MSYLSKHGTPGWIAITANLTSQGAAGSFEVHPDPAISPICSCKTPGCPPEVGPGVDAADAVVDGNVEIVEANDVESAGCDAKDEQDVRITTNATG
jgi:hypothetical protein